MIGVAAKFVQQLVLRFLQHRPRGEAVVAKVRTPPATSSLLVAPTVVLAERTPTKWIMLKR